jgi:hypothetical protein
MTNQEAMKLALEALKSMKKTLAEHEEPTTFNEDEAIKALEEALNQEQGEPVGYTDEHGNAYQYGYTGPKFAPNIQLYTTPQPKQKQGEPVALKPCGYASAEKKMCRKCGQVHAEAIFDTTPQQRKPLTDEQIYEIHENSSNLTEFTRAIEAAHGITK